MLTIELLKQALKKGLKLILALIIKKTLPAKDAGGYTLQIHILSIIEMQCFWWKSLPRIIYKY